MKAKKMNKESDKKRKNYRLIKAAMTAAGSSGVFRHASINFKTRA
jgi:hypothetical protein